LKRDLIAHVGTLDFVAGRENVVFLGPPVIRLYDMEKLTKKSQSRIVEIGPGVHSCCSR